MRQKSQKPTLDDDTTCWRAFSRFFKRYYYVPLRAAALFVGPPRPRLHPKPRPMPDYIPAPKYIPFSEKLLVRPIEDAPSVKVSIRDLLAWYMTSADFITGDRYPRGTMPLESEVGYLAIIQGRQIYPVVRILCPPETTEGKDTQ